MIPLLPEIRDQIKSLLDFQNEDKIQRQEDLLFVNKNESLFYEINKNSLNFSSVDEKRFNGYFDFKPFYLKASFNYDGISAKDIFSPGVFWISKL